MYQIFGKKNNIRTETHLFIVATEQQQAGKKDLYNFVINHSPKSLQDLIVTTWKMQDAKASLARRNTPGMDMIRQEATNASSFDGGILIIYDFVKSLSF